MTTNRQWPPPGVHRIQYFRQRCPERVLNTAADPWKAAGVPYTVKWVSKNDPRYTRVQQEAWTREYDRRYGSENCRVQGTRNVYDPHGTLSSGGAEGSLGRYLGRVPTELERQDTLHSYTIAKIVRDAVHGTPQPEPPTSPPVPPPPPSPPPPDPVPESSKPLTTRVAELEGAVVQLIFQVTEVVKTVHNISTQIDDLDTYVTNHGEV